jgi:anti-anti-sigma factor
MKVVRKLIGDVAVFEIEGEIDAEHSVSLKRAMEKSFMENAKHLVLNLEKVGFIDSTGLGVFISLMRKLKERGGEIRLAALQDEVKAIFEITRLYRVFDISRTPEEAIQEIKKTGG